MSSGARDAYPFKKAHASDVERILSAVGASEKLANLLTDKESQLLEADLSYIGLHPGRTQLTLPERLILKWLLVNGYSFGGVAPNITNPNADFFSQYPLGGGRTKSGGGNVADVYISANASKTKMGISLAIDGSYFHQQVATAARDNAQDLILRSKGYVTARIRDNVVYEKGSRNEFMMNLVGHK